jgi:hypothetical protein
MKPQIKFRLDYSCSPLWTNDEETRTKYDYNIDLKEIGLTTKTSEKAEIVVSMFYESLNPIYQGFPSFWREKLCVDFNQKVTDVYDSICMEIGNEFEIIDFTEKLSEDKRRSSFLNDPVDYCLQHGVRFRDGDELVKEVESEHIKYLRFEKLGLSNQLQWNESMSLRTFWSDRIHE